MAAQTPHGSLPTPRTRLLGRVAEIETARAQLLDDAVPLLTLTGPGGVGKTRLALAIARDVAHAFSDGVIWVNLASLTDPSQVLVKLAQAVDASVDANGVSADTVIDTLHAQQMLLVLDNCEHLLPALADLVGVLLVRCSVLQVLATSRAPLHLHGEHVFPVEPLPLPEDDADFSTISSNAAVQLFTERARAVRPSFSLTAATAASVIALCHQLEGLPLAIELAAARSAAFPPEALLTQMHDRLQLLSHGPRNLPSRQQTMRDTIAWSYDLLPEVGQRLLRRLAVFAGGFTIEAAQAVAPPRMANGDVLIALELLVTQSLVRSVDGDGPSRFSLLETVRAFGRERLAAAGEEHAVHEHHATYFLQLVRALDDDHDASWNLNAITREQPNIRVAIEHLERVRALEHLLALASAVANAWIHHGDALEVRRWLERGLAQDEHVSPQTRAWALASLAGVLFQLHGEAEAGLAYGEQALSLSQADDWALQARAAPWCGLNALRLGQAERADRFFRQALDAELQRPVMRPRTIAHLDNLRGQAALVQGELTQAEALFASARTREREREAELGPFPFLAYPLIGLGHVARCRGTPKHSLSFYQDGLSAAMQARDVRAMALSLAGIAGSWAALGNWRDAATVFGATEALCHRSGLSFDEFALAWQRAAGLPEPWQRTTEPLGWLTPLRTQVQQERAAGLAAIPDVDEAEVGWAAGRQMRVTEAVAMALAIDSPQVPTSSRHPGPGNHRSPFEHAVSLTYREHEVLHLLCQRRTDAEIAAQLFLSPRTASNHVSAILRKLDAHNRRDAVAIAVRLGLVEHARHPLSPFE